ncbi:MAG: hypothetical protein M0009_16115 [Deltaproteobacteria bacterium]|nr:hypothetical protein [Deltaproteobacteria bacterium]
MKSRYLPIIVLFLLLFYFPARADMPQASKYSLPLFTSQPPQELAADAEIVLISGHTGANKNETGTVVNIEVNRPGSRVLLILENVNQIHWNVTASPSTAIAGIVASGLETPTVTTSALTQGYRVRLPSAYDKNHTGYKQLLTTLHYWFGINKLDVFRGMTELPNVISVTTLSPVIFAEVGVKVGIPAQERLKSCDPGIAINAANEIIHSTSALKEPLDLFAPAFVFYKRGKKDEAVFWYFAAELRTKYQLAFEKEDRGQLLQIMRMTIGPPILNYAFQDISNCCRILDSVLEWDKKTPNPFRDNPKTESAEKQIAQIYAGLREYKAKLIAEKSDIENKAKQAAPDIEQTYVKADPPCQKGQLDPAHLNWVIMKERSLVENFIAFHSEVIQKAKGVSSVSVATYKVRRQEVLPYRYIVSVYGLDKQPWEKDFRPVYVAVDVSRQNGAPEFKVACMVFSTNHRMPSFTDEECRQSNR